VTNGFGRVLCGDASSGEKPRGKIQLLNHLLALSLTNGRTKHDYAMLFLTHIKVPMHRICDKPFKQALKPE
jgi:hypothetical protein